MGNRPKVDDDDNDDDDDDENEPNMTDIVQKHETKGKYQKEVMQIERAITDYSASA